MAYVLKVTGRRGSPPGAENERHHGDDHGRLQESRSTTLPTQDSATGDETERYSGEHDDRESRPPHRERCESHHEQRDGTYHDQSRCAGTCSKWKCAPEARVAFDVIEVLGDLACEVQRHSHEEERD